MLHLARLSFPNDVREGNGEESKRFESSLINYVMTTFFEYINSLDHNHSTMFLNPINYIMTSNLPTTNVRQAGYSCFVLYISAYSSLSTCTEAICVHITILVKE